MGNLLRFMRMHKGCGSEDYAVSRQGLREVQKNVLESKHMGIMCKRQECRG